MKILSRINLQNKFFILREAMTLYRYIGISEPVPIQFQLRTAQIIDKGVCILKVTRLYLTLQRQQGYMCRAVATKT